MTVAAAYAGLALITLLGAAALTDALADTRTRHHGQHRSHR